MKKRKLLILTLATVLLSGCAAQQSNAKDGTADKEEIKRPTIQSMVEQSDCCICGNNERSLMPYYRQMDSIGVVCLNTMYIANTDVRTYDDDGNELIGSTYYNSTSSSHGKGECSFWTDGMPSRGIGRIKISYGEKSSPAWDKIKEFLCQSCVDKVVEMYVDELEWQGDNARFPEVCIVDFQTNELYPLGKTQLSYFVRDYYVHIDHEDDGDDITVFYAPKIGEIEE